LASRNPFNEDGSDISVSLSKTCKPNEECKGLENVYLEDSVSGTCVEKEPHPDVMGVRFPGEDCDDIHQCIDEPNFKSTCQNNKCWGKKENEACSSPSECLVGLYCNGEICKPQVKLGGACKEVYDCENNLGCYNGKCIKFGTLKENEDISFAKIGEFNNDPRRSLLCEFGKVDFEDGDSCAVHRYAGETKKNVSPEGFVKCNWGEKCTYSDGKNLEERDCQCGYNAEGQGYCPLSQDDYHKEWKNAVQHQINKLDNKCHSKSRFECYKVDEQLHEQDAVHQHLTEQAHVFHKSVKCAHDVLSANSVGLKFFAIIMTILAILF